MYFSHKGSSPVKWRSQLHRACSATAQSATKVCDPWAKCCCALDPCSIAGALLNTCFESHIF